MQLFPRPKSRVRQGPFVVDFYHGNKIILISGISKKIGFFEFLPREIQKKMKMLKCWIDFFKKKKGWTILNFKISKIIEMFLNLGPPRRPGFQNKWKFWKISFFIFLSFEILKFQNKFRCFFESFEMLLPLFKILIFVLRSLKCCSHFAKCS